MTLTVACVQLNCQNDMEANLTQATDLIKEAADQGATFITTPENMSLMVDPNGPYRGKKYTESDHPALAQMLALTHELNIWLLIGSLTIYVPEQEKLANRSYLLSPEGKVHAYYDKIHLFDVTLPNGEFFQESKRFLAGEQATLTQTPWGKLGMTICYDLRFPHLFRHLAQQGADIITVPAAFTYLTGEAHWHTLLRARAIENGCFIIAPNQTGYHPGNRRTYGHSLIISPWGEILADQGEEEGILCHTLDLSAIGKAREAIPSLQHDRPF